MKRNTLTSWNAQSPIGSLKPNQSWSTSNIPCRKSLPNTSPNVNSSAIAWVRVFLFAQTSDRTELRFYLSAGRECGRFGPIRWHLGEELQWTNCYRYSSLQLLHQVSALPIKTTSRNKFSVTLLVCSQCLSADGINLWFRKGHCFGLDCMNYSLF